MRLLRYFLCSILLLAFIGQAGASVPLGGNRKGAGGRYDMYGCMLSNDYYVVNFAAYQIDPNTASLPQAECIDLPAAGKTQISIDLLDLDVRKKPVALKILAENGQILAERPMAVVKQGVLSTSVDFPAAGKYQAVLLVDDTDLNTPLEAGALHMPLTVGVASKPSGGGSGLLILFAALAVIVAAAGYWLPRLLAAKPSEQAS